MKYILFDLDGTITDPKEGITKSVAYALNKFGIQVEDLDVLCPFIGPPLRASFEKFYGFSEKDAELAVKYYREYYGMTGKFECSIYEGIPELLKYLKEQGRTVFLATSKPTGYAKEILEHFDLLQYFDYVAGSSMDASRTEKADVIRHALEQIPEAKPEEMVMIGDREFDYYGAKEFGIPCILVTYGYGSLEELEACKSFAIQETTEGLKEFFKQQS